MHPWIADANAGWSGHTNELAAREWVKECPNWFCWLNFQAGAQFCFLELEVAGADQEQLSWAGKTPVPTCSLPSDAPVVACGAGADQCVRRCGAFLALLEGVGQVGQKTLYI